MNIKSISINFICVNLLFFAFIFPSHGQSTLMNWHLSDYSEEGFNGINREKLFAGMDNVKKQPVPVIVAVLDSGVEVDHEDLDDVLWVNEDEIPNNGIDDDKNGYIDDIHGWNFLGGKDGENVDQDTYEATRLVAKYRKMFKNADPDKLSKKEKKIYDQYIEMKKEVEKSQKSAESRLAALESQTSMIDAIIDEIKSVIGTLPINDLTIKAIDEDQGTEYAQMKSYLSQIIKETGQDFESADQLGDFMKSDMNDALDYYRTKALYAHNPDFDPRHIIGDDFSDPYQKGHGNNNYEGPDATHGTHVAGIIAAENDDKGATGISPTAKIMTVRVVPDGDERDKDVANGIFYAVDNGAKIINMSFGKGYSPRKKVVDKAIRYAQRKGVLLVHAAGNSSQNNDTSLNFPTPIFDRGGLFRSKYAKTWIEVGALGPYPGENMIASFSNYGYNSVDIFAPGVSIYAPVVDNTYKNLSGTSMASPVVAGAAALVWSYFPELSAKQIRQVIIEGGRPISDIVKSPSREIEEKVNFQTLSKTGKILDLHKSFMLAAQMSR